ncbi:MAG: McrC family protein [Pseudohongiellaceae bacterium]
MIHRTISEWEVIKHDPDLDNEKTIPDEAASRIAATAAAFSLSGLSGRRVLEHRRDGLRARGVVGLIAAEGCSLEILPKIDIHDSDTTEENVKIRQRLIYMLEVALDIRIDVGMITELEWQKETLLEVLIRAFSEKLIEAVRKGVPRRYIEQEDDLPMLRGSLNVTRQFTVHAANPSHLACRFNTLSEDIAINQIMKAAVTLLRRHAQTFDNQRRLRELEFAYSDIAEVPVAALRRNKPIINRTNERWRDLFNLAWFLLEHCFQTTTSGKGRGFSLLFEMNTLFERYVTRLAIRALSGTNMIVVPQGGLKFCLIKEPDKGLFQTKPDILIEYDDEVIHIVDTKWKRISKQIDDSKQGISQGDVYQMMAYGQVYQCRKLTLLYPHHGGLGEDEGVHSSYRVAKQEARLRFATFDVAKDKKIVERLHQLLRWQ